MDLSSRSDRCTKVSRRLAYTHISEVELLPIMAVQQRQDVDAVGCRAFLSRLISIFAISDILKIPCACSIHLHPSWLRASC